MNPCNNSDKRGQVAICRHGKVGIITHETQFFDKAIGKYRTRYLGVRVIGGEWESVDPTFIAPDVLKFFLNVIEKNAKAAPVPAGPDPVPH